MRDPDLDTIQLVLAGDKRAYARLVDRHKEKAMTLAMRMLRSREDAEEALQDAFVRAYRALPRFELKSTFSTWLYRIVYNVCASALSRRGGGQHVSLDVEDGEGEKVTEVADPELPPDVALESREAERIILEEVERLPAVYAATFTLFVVQEMTYEEIVQVAGVPLGTVKARLFRARTMLRDAVARRLGARVRKEVAA